MLSTLREEKKKRKKTKDFFLRGPVEKSALYPLKGFVAERKQAFFNGALSFHSF